MQTYDRSSAGIKALAAAPPPPTHAVSSDGYPVTMRERVETVKRALNLASEDRISVSEMDALMRRLGINLSPESLRQVYGYLGEDTQGVYDGKALWMFAEMFPALLESMYTRVQDLESDDRQQLAIQDTQDELHRLGAERESVQAALEQARRSKEAAEEALQAADGRIEESAGGEDGAREALEELAARRETAGDEVRRLREGLDGTRDGELRSGRALRAARAAVQKAADEHQARLRRLSEAELSVASLEKQLAAAEEERDRRAAHAAEAEERVQGAREREEEAQAELDGAAEPLEQAQEGLLEAEKEQLELQNEQRTLRARLAQAAQVTELHTRARDAARTAFGDCVGAEELRAGELESLEAEIRRVERQAAALEAQNEEWRRARKAVADEDLELLEQELALRNERKAVEDEERDFRESAKDYQSGGRRRTVLSDLRVNAPAVELSQRRKESGSGATGGASGACVSPSRPGHGLRHPLGVDGPRVGEEVGVARAGNGTHVVALAARGMLAQSKNTSPARTHNPEAPTADMLRAREAEAEAALQRKARAAVEEEAAAAAAAAAEVTQRRVSAPNVSPPRNNSGSGGGGVHLSTRRIASPSTATAAGDRDTSPQRLGSGSVGGGGGGLNFESELPVRAVSRSGVKTTVIEKSDLRSDHLSYDGGDSASVVHAAAAATAGGRLGSPSGGGGASARRSEARSWRSLRASGEAQRATVGAGPGAAPVAIPRSPPPPPPQELPLPSTSPALAIRQRYFGIDPYPQLTAAAAAAAAAAVAPAPPPPQLATATATATAAAMLARDLSLSPQPVASSPPRPQPHAAQPVVPAPPPVHHLGGLPPPVSPTLSPRGVVTHEHHYHLQGSPVRRPLTREEVVDRIMVEDEAALAAAAAGRQRYRREPTTGAAGGQRAASQQRKPVVDTYLQPSKYQVAMQQRRREREEKKRAKEEAERARQVKTQQRRRSVPEKVGTAPCYLSRGTSSPRLVVPVSL